MQINVTGRIYPYNAYIPSSFCAGIFAIIVYISLLGWFIQSLHFKCRPRFLSIFLFIIHLTIFIELILRGTLHINILNTKLLYRVTSPLLSVPARLLLFSNYHCLVELRGKTPRRLIDRIIDIIVPICTIIADILLSIANELSFNSKYINLSFYLRQGSAGFILFLSLFFYLIWYLAVSHARRLYIFPLLIVSSTSVVIQAIYIQILSIPSFFFLLNQNELWFYIGHLIPLVLALTTWSIFHPWRLLPPSEEDVPRDETGKELLPTSSSSLI